MQPREPAAPQPDLCADQAALPVRIVFDDDARTDGLNDIRHGERPGDHPGNNVTPGLEVASVDPVADHRQQVRREWRAGHGRDS
jgi:hypothetical protein